MIYALQCDFHFLSNKKKHFSLSLSLSKHSIPSSYLITLVSSLVISRLDYCISALSGAPYSRLCRLQSILNASARLIFRASRYSSVTPLLRTLEWLPVKRRIDYRLAILAFSCHHRRAPSYLISDLSTRASQGCRQLRSSQSRSVASVFTRHPTLGGRSFAASAARVWNSLPPILRLTDNPHAFKRELKSLFIDM